MLKYLIIQLCDSSPSFCHYPKANIPRRLMPIEILREAIFFGMKENLNIQFLYPDYEVADEYKKLIDTIDHTNIVSINNKDSQLLSDAEVVVLDNWTYVSSLLEKDKSYIVRTSKEEFFDNYKRLFEVLPLTDRINVVFTDIDEFNDADYDRYRVILSEISGFIAKEYIGGHFPQSNLLTDRLILKSMNNCNAGSEVVTIAPDGNFYVCPAFYLQGDRNIGDLKGGMKIVNPQLYQLKFAPICRECDAYQCKRCIWLNKKLTLEVNTPSSQQCMVSHFERNATRNLLNQIRRHGVFMPDIEIEELNYFDPFDKIINKK